MTHPMFHAESSVRRFGGKNEDYLPIHQWLDSSKQEYCDFRHRALRQLGDFASVLGAIGRVLSFFLGLESHTAV